MPTAQMTSHNALRLQLQMEWNIETGPEGIHFVKSSKNVYFKKMTSSWTWCFYLILYMCIIWLKKHYSTLWPNCQLFEIQGKEKKGYHCRENHKRSCKIVDKQLESWRRPFIIQWHKSVIFSNQTAKMHCKNIKFLIPKERGIHEFLNVSVFSI